MPRPQARNWLFVVDEEFAEAICSVAWRKHRAGYLMGRPDGRKTVTMHRYVWNLAGKPDSETLDHINRVPWDNRLCNLRAASRRLQALNTKERLSPVSGLPRGVVPVDVRREESREYAARGTLYGKVIHLGVFKTIEEASLVYSEWLRKETERELNGQRQGSRSSGFD